jgi:MFS family permease
MQTTTPRLVFTLCVLLGINTMNFFDRQILPAVQEKIRKEWRLSDSELGWLGTAFILLYAAVGVPLGRLADVGRRKWILAGGVALWSVMTFGGGFAWGFWSLFVLRLGVGVGEASCAPTASSLIGDLVPPERRARAMGVFMLGLPVGLALSFPISGTIAAHFGWEKAFFVAAVPGLLLAVLALFIAEPARGAADRHASAPLRPLAHVPAGREESITALPSGGKEEWITTPVRAGGESGERRAATPLPFLAVVRRVLSMPTMWWIIASGALHNFNMYALGTFLSSFLQRYHGLSVEAAGWVSGLAYGLGALGIFAAAWLGDRAFRRDVSGRLHVAWVGLAAVVPCLLLALAAPAGAWLRCAAWLLPGCMLLYAYYGTVYATIQDIIEPPLRGMAMAIYFCAMYFLGAVLGPVATGWASDHFARQAAAADRSTPPGMIASTVGLLGAPLGQGPFLAASALFPGRPEVVMERHKAIGLHDAMYLIPILNAALVVVLFAASRTVKGDYQRCRERMAGAAGAGG